MFGRGVMEHRGFTRQGWLVAAGPSKSTAQERFGTVGSFRRSPALFCFCGLTGVGTELALLFWVLPHTVLLRRLV